MLGRPKFVLASGSPRRLGLINQAGIEPDALRPANVDETPRRSKLSRCRPYLLARTEIERHLFLITLFQGPPGCHVCAACTMLAFSMRCLPTPELSEVYCSG